MSYLSRKIKSNTLKISQSNKEDGFRAPTERPSERPSQIDEDRDSEDQEYVKDEPMTTASRSDLSIDEHNLRRFKEYML